MRHPKDTAIGGYFSLETRQGAMAPPFPSDAIGYQSARSAIAAVLAAAGAKRAWVPNFVCGAVLDALASSGIEARRYSLGVGCGVPADIEVSGEDWIVCVDYFGVTAAACDEAIRRFGSHRVLVDASQSLFHAARPGCTAVYSPRKFVGVPDGGLLSSPIRPGPLLDADEAGSRHRGRYLATRGGGDVTAGYREFQEAEASLSDCSPLAMSEATRRILESVDWQEVRNRRASNYRFLAGSLPAGSLRFPALPAAAVPLCCPIRFPDAASLRATLASEGIFTAMYWPDSSIPPEDEIGHALREHTVYLPCDQRYGGEDMHRITVALARHLG